MQSREFRRFRALVVRVLCLTGIWMAANGRRVADASDTILPAAADRLVEEALRAEAAGENARRRVLLSVAIDAAPDFSPARWHSGQVLVDGKWTSVEEAQQVAAADPRRKEYVQLRATCGDSFVAQLELARWCRRNGFEEEAQFHWRTVLSHQPNHEEALRALGVRWHNGQLLTFAEIEAIKERTRQHHKRVKEFASLVAKWERLLDAGGVKSRDQALGEIRAIDDVHAIPALEELTLGTTLSNQKRFDRCLQVSLATIDAMDAMRAQAATQSLLRHAVISPQKSVREAAIVALKKRPPHDYVPPLLSVLAMPIESSYRVVTDDDGSVHYFHSLYREGPNADWSFEGRLSAMQHDLQGPTLITVDDRVRDEVTETRFGARNNPAILAEMASVASFNQRRFGIGATVAEQQVAATNRVIAASNRVVVPVLTALTGEDLGENPQAWWDWWQQYNEYSSDGESPVYERRIAESTHRYYRPPEQHAYRINLPPPPRGRYGSCFAKGTLVWSKTGQVEIETIEIGDLVLAQNVDTGELAYRPVIGRTLRPPTAILRFKIEDEVLQTTLGHPFWVAGRGWRMAKELGEGAILHGVDGPVCVEAIATADEAEAYNLIVAEFNTYFVGDSGVLVHDNTLRQPTTAIVPGLAAK